MGGGCGWVPLHYLVTSEIDFRLSEAVTIELGLMLFCGFCEFMCFDDQCSSKALLIIDNYSAHIL